MVDVHALNPKFQEFLKASHKLDQLKADQRAQQAIVKQLESQCQKILCDNKQARQAILIDEFHQEEYGQYTALRLSTQKISESLGKKRIESLLLEIFSEKFGGKQDPDHIAAFAKQTADQLWNRRLAKEVTRVLLQLPPKKRSEKRKQTTITDSAAVDDEDEEHEIEDYDDEEEDAV